MSDPGVVQTIFETALQAGIDPYLALAVAQQESGFDPYAVGDNGNSFGLFQENVNGRGAGRAPDFDIVGQTMRFASDVLAYLQTNPNASPGEIAAAVQRPADPVGYAQSVDSIYGGGGDMSYDPNLFGDPNNPDPTDPTTAGTYADTRAAAFPNEYAATTGGGTGTPTTPKPFDPRTDRIIPGTTVSIPGGTQFQYRDAQGNLQTGFAASGSTGSATTPRSLEVAAAAAGYYNPDGTPNTIAYLQAQAAKQGGSGAAAPKILTIGGGRYAFVYPDGHTEIKDFSGGTAVGGPPSLDPSRSSIVAYLQALLHQNDLPYAGIGQGTAAPSPAAPATPAAVAPPYDTTHGIQTITPPPNLPVPGNLSIPGVGPVASVPSGGMNTGTAPAPFQFSSLGLAPGVLPSAGAPSLLTAPNLSAAGTLATPKDPTQPTLNTRSY